MFLTDGTPVHAGRALWLSRFDYSGDIEAVIIRAEGILQTGWEIHLVLIGVPPPLLPLYEKHLAQIGRKYGLKYSLNINRQQIQNILFYRRFDLLHIYHPCLLPLGATLGKSFRLPWLASCPTGGEREEHASGHADSTTNPGSPLETKDREDNAGGTDLAVFAYLREADAVTCSCSTALQRLQPLLSPFFENPVPLCLIPWGVKTTGVTPSLSSSPPQSSPPGFTSPPAPQTPQPSRQQIRCSILYAGPLEKKHLIAFQALNQVVQSRDDCTLDVFSGRRPLHFSGGYHPWTPSFREILKDYTAIAGHGYFLLQALAAGKIALLLEEKYAGIFSPFTRREAVPAWQARLPAGKNKIEENKADTEDPRKAMQWYLPQPATGDQSTEGKCRKDPQKIRGAHREVKGKPRQILQLSYAGQNPGKQQRQSLQIPRTGRDTKEMLQRDLLMLSTNRAAREKLQRDGWRYARENHDPAIVAEKMRRLYSFLLSQTAR